MKKIMIAAIMMMFAAPVFSQQIFNIKTSNLQDGDYEQYFGTIKV